MINDLEIALSDEVKLRLYTKTDVIGLHEIVQNERERLTDWLSSAGPLRTKNEVHNYIRYNENCYHAAIAGEKSIFAGFQLAITADEVLAGQVGFQTINRKHDMASVGYWLSEKFEGKGIMTQACRELVAYGFSVLQLNRIEIQCAEDNLRSQSIPERLGFIKEARLTQVEKRGDTYYDHILYRMLNKEWI